MRWLFRIVAIALFILGLALVPMRDVKVAIDSPPGSGRTSEQVPPGQALPVIHLVGGVLVVSGLALGLASFRRRRA